jgi:hypothetical protein
VHASPTIKISRKICPKNCVNAQFTPLQHATWL